jgi:hypothetical protein
MSGYTVTITPSGDQSGPQTTVQVDTTSGAARVTELTVKAGGNGLSPQELPVIDLALLVAALAPSSTPAITAAPAATPAPAASTARTRQPRGRRARKAAEAPAKATRGRRRAAVAVAEAPKAGRAYRRMPAQDEVVAAWNESNSASALAAHFDVPRHTAQGWLRRLRSMGVIEPAS